MTTKKTTKTIKDLKKALVKKGLVTEEQVKPVITEKPKGGPKDEEAIECPMCHGDAVDCPRCHGDGFVFPEPAKKSAEPKAKKEPRVDISADTRRAFIAALEKLGFTGNEKSGWIRFQVKDTKVSVASKGPQVHLRFAGSEMDHAGLERISDVEAKKRHLGSVRRILWLDRQTTEVVRDIAKMIAK